MTKLLEEMASDWGSLVEHYNVNEKAAAILILAESISNLGNCSFQPAMREFGHELALSLKNVLQESVLRTETDITGNLAVTE
jgi:hypothetical protein